MTPVFIAIFLLGLSSLATAANFNTVYEWPKGLDYELPSEANRTQALRDDTLKASDSDLYFEDSPVTQTTPTTTTFSQKPKPTPLQVARSMTPFCIAIFLLCHSSLATAANFTQVYEWPNNWDLDWPSEAKWAIMDGSYYRFITEPLFMAVYGSRIFFMLVPNEAIPVGLVSLPTSSASAAPPKITPFPSWDVHEYEICNHIESPKGLEVDSVGQLWVLDVGSKKCNSKIWTIDLNNNDCAEIIHQFSFYGELHELVLDETPNETFAYISRQYEQNIVVFSLERNESWTVVTPGIDVLSLALSPKDQEPRQLYLGQWNSTELYSIPVDVLRSGTRTANPKLIGNWSARPYRMLIDEHGTMYTAFLKKNFIHSWNSSQPFLEQQFFEVDGLDTYYPFTIALDQNGTLWMTVFDYERKPRYRLFKAAVGEPSFEDS
ncbi:protein yellow-like [Cloeon dipterum]|uniref:protein yellow-like n=1 Tax=Cloeon dipterum TaxID=197152 RepID=UPI00321F9A08